MTEIHDISILITTYNQEEHVEKAIQSALNQELTPNEIIVVDDNSTDSTPEIIKTHTDRHPEIIEAHFLEEEHGIPQTRNYALKQATGELITYLDGDDVFHSSKLAKETKKLANSPDCDLVFSNFEYIDADGQTLGRWSDDDDVPTGDVFKECITRSFPDGNLFRDELVRTDAIRNIGGYDTDLPILEDWDLRIRLARTEKVAYVPEVLTAYRRYGGGVSTRKDSKESAEIYEKIINKHVDIIADEFGWKERQLMKRKLRKILAEQRMYAAADQGRPLRTLKKYMIFVILDPYELINLRKQIKGGIERFIR